jgi:hypothetical protein
MPDHIDDTTLNALLDDELAAAERPGAHAHLESCAACAAELAALRSLRQQLAALPRDLAPARDLLQGIHARMDAAAVVPLRAAVAGESVPRGARPRLVHRTIGGSLRELAAAAAVLIVLSSAVTAILLERLPAPSAQPEVARASEPPGSGVESRFVSATRELERVLDTQRAGLSPETVRILEDNLLIIDTALAEARAALRADPGNAALSEILMATYEKKLDLLRRAATSVTT